MGIKTYFICAGEASGDVHGANLMKAMLALDSNIKFVGVGGPKMRTVGLDCFIEAEKLSVIGFVEVFKNIRFFKRTLADLLKKMLSLNITAFIPIDFPDFNLRLAKQAHLSGIKTVYYICPQVWAWRKGRIKDIENIIDLLLTIFPFEADYFDPKKLKVEYVGHPLLDEVPVDGKRTFCEPNQGKLAIMPGSRTSEIEHHMPTLVDFMTSFHNDHPEVEFHIPCAQTLKEESLYAYIPNDASLSFKKSLTIHKPGESTPVLTLCDAALIASGTSTLQGVLRNIPCVIFYKLNGFTFWLGSKLIKLPFIGLVNLVAEKLVSKELLQTEMSVESLTNESENLLWNKDYRTTMYSNYDLVREKLGGTGASNRAAEEILKFTS